MVPAVLLIEFRRKLVRKGCKSVKALHREGVLVKEGAEYAVSGEWLRVTSAFFERIEAVPREKMNL